MKRLKGKIRNFINSLKQNGIKTEIRRITNYIKYKKTVLDEYDEWMLLNEPSEKELKEQEKRSKAQNTKFTVFIECEESKIKIPKQTYNNYEIKILNKNEYFSCIENDKSDYVIFVGQDIRLLPFSLYEIQRYIEYNECDLIYTDNDWIIDGKRVNPEFKPHYAYDNILSKNYFGNFIIVKTKFLQANKNILLNLNEKEPIYNITLRTINKTNFIRHINSIIFEKEKEIISELDQISIIKEYLNENDILYKDVKKGKFYGQYKIDYMINSKPKISIVIPTMDHVEDLDKAIQSILKSTYNNYEIIIIENNSRNKETFEYYEKIKKQDERIIVEKIEINEFNYSRLVNFGVDKSSGEYILLLNNDVEIITNDWLEQMLMYTQRQDVGMCGAKMYFEDRSIQHAGVTIGIRGLAGHKYREIEEKDFDEKDGINYVQDLSAVTAACCMIKKDLYNRLLGFDEKLAVAFNDVDFCMKVRKEKLLIVYNPFVELYHYESKSRGQEDTTEKQKRFAKEYAIFVKRWSRELSKGDIYYSINYRLDTDIPQINYNRIKGK